MRFIMFLVLFKLASSADLDDDILSWVNNMAGDIPGSSGNTPSHNGKFGRKRACTTDDNVDGVCVKTSECETETEKLDPNGWRPRRGECHYLQQCCPQTKVRTPTRAGTITVSPGCGWSNPGANVFREISNTYADYGEFPWMVAVLKKSGKRARWSKQNYVAGGSLIHPSVVMTVAHRVEQVDADKIKCRAGEWDTKTDQEVYEHQEREVRKIVSHNDYTRTNVHNDIALLVMSRPFELENVPHIGLACLGRSLPPPSTQCYSMGWGTDFNDRKKYAVILKKIKLPLVSPDSCQSSLRRTDLGKKFTLHASFTCAGGEEGVDTCIGDGGSPLVCPIGEQRSGFTRFSVFGMVAFGAQDCGEKEVPGVYVNIPEMSRWVDDQMLLEGFDKSVYVN